MKLHYYPETDSLYIELKTDAGVETRVIAEGLTVDLDSARRRRRLRHRPGIAASRSDDARSRVAAAPNDARRLKRGGEERNRWRRGSSRSRR